MGLRLSREFRESFRDLGKTISVNAEGQCVTKDGVSLDDIPMPPGIVGKLITTEVVSGEH